MIKTTFAILSLALLLLPLAVHLTKFDRSSLTSSEREKYKVDSTDLQIERFKDLFKISSSSFYHLTIESNDKEKILKVPAREFAIKRLLTYLWFSLGHPLDNNLVEWLKLVELLPFDDKDFLNDFNSIWKDKKSWFEEWSKEAKNPVLRGIIDRAIKNIPDYEENVKKIKVLPKLKEKKILFDQTRMLIAKSIVPMFTRIHEDYDCGECVT